MLRIKELRKERNISQKELAEYLNITQVQISKYELQKNEPDLEIIKKIATYFNVTIEYLIGETEDNILLITRKDFEDLKLANEMLYKIIDKIEPKKTKNNNNIKIGNNNTIKNSFNNKK